MSILVRVLVLVIGFGIAANIMVFFPELVVRPARAAWNFARGIGLLAGLLWHTRR